MKGKKIDTVLHLGCPNINWESEGKSKLDLNFFIDALESAKKQVCRQKKNDDALTEAELISYSNEVLNSSELKFTVRQIHYQLLSKYPEEYSKLGKKACSILGKALTRVRERREIDPDRIVDMSRPEHLNNPAFLTCEDYEQQSVEKLIEDCDMERWKTQNCLVEIWIEKEALSRIILPTCKKYRVNLIVGKGFNSFSQVYRAVKNRFPIDGKKLVILYFGDHDPSGFDIEDSLKGEVKG